MNSRRAEIVGLGSPFSYKFILQTKSQTIRDFKSPQSSQRPADLNHVSQSNGHNFYRKPFFIVLFLKVLLISPYKVSVDQTGGLNLNVEEETTGLYGYWI